ncbi:nitrate ABC transporter permease [Pseudanabaena sp. ABRG5-3]|uniref:nitrate ABC transporter permease n=1 Tax=Pseudanabaena sp. ABRG5-3 TaxID=685565 RepID=UPI000DC6E024|nr:nitrate ABC transporter permease [Pseudanabaena sp. ABRG5-3]BBC27155.1 nitrate ABC transporter, permease protein [Pseudanabaena sp. ABRG5-3]
MMNEGLQSFPPKRKSFRLNKDQWAFLLFIGILGLFLGLWELGATLKIFLPIMPSASQTLADFWFWLSNPFFDNGPNDQGIGLLLVTSLRRVLVGFLIGSAIAIPLGILIGLSEIASKAVDPFIQILRPVSPLAWLPLGLALMKDSEKTALFVIAITSIWPTLISTKFGVSNVDSAYLNVARTLGASRWRTITKVILPAAAPSIVSGLRISLGIAWLVIVAAEILLSGGIGYFVWNEWNNLKITSIITAILVVGIVGLLMDRLFGLLQNWVSFGQKS